MQTVARSLNIDSKACVDWIAPLLFVHLAIAVAVFWLLTARAEAKERAEAPPAEKEEAEAPPFRVHWLKAAVPLLPLALLFLTGPPLNIVAVPRHWLMGPKDPADARPDSRLIAVAMLIGVAAAGTVGGRDKVGGLGVAFFDGAGYAYTHIISLIVAATCFSEGVKAVGLARLLGDLIGAAPGLLTPCAAALPLLFAVLCGSGMASTQGLFDSFKGAALAAHASPLAAGAVVSIAAAAGRTMSPVAAVTLMASNLSGAAPLALARRVRRAAAGGAGRGGAAAAADAGVTAASGASDGGPVRVREFAIGRQGGAIHWRERSHRRGWGRGHDEA